MRDFFRELFSTVLELLGAGLVVYGVAQVSIPAALVLAGVALVVIGYTLSLPVKAPEVIKVEADPVQ